MGRSVLLGTLLISLLGCAQWQKKDAASGPCRELTQLKEKLRGWPALDLLQNSPAFYSFDHDQVFFCPQWPVSDGTIAAPTNRNFRFHLVHEKVALVNWDFWKNRGDFVDQFLEFSLLNQGASRLVSAPARKPRHFVYPLLTQPRYYRWKMIELLREYQKKPDQLNLNHFTYWYNKWKNEFPEEYKEEKVSKRSLLVLLKQTLKPNKHLKQDVKDFLSLEHPSPSRFQASFEAEFLAPLAFNIIEANSIATRDEIMNQQTTLLDLLAKSSTEKKVKTLDFKIQNKILRNSVMVMEDLDPEGKIDVIIRQLADPQTAKLVIDHNKSHHPPYHSLYQSYFNFPGVKGVKIFELVDDSFVSTPQGQLELSKELHWVTATQTPCQHKGESTLFLFDKKEFNYSNGVLSAKIPRRFEVKARKVKKGHTLWFCT